MKLMGKNVVFKIHLRGSLRARRELSSLLVSLFSMSPLTSDKQVTAGQQIQAIPGAKTGL